jgi:hypothetical protein
VRSRRELYWVVGFDVEFDLFAREGAHSVGKWLDRVRLGEGFGGWT